MEQKGLLEELTAAMLEYQRMLPCGTYHFAPEIQLGKMTGRIVEERADFPENSVPPAESDVVFGFFPLGFVPKSLKGAPASWLCGYPFLSGLERLGQAPDFFLEQLKQHVEDRLRSMKDAAGAQPVEQWSPPYEDAP